MTAETVMILAAGVFGLVLGSFLNVCIVRLPANQSVVRPRSRCPRCGKGIAWYDNLPVIGWIKLGGKCRYCREPISARYPIVEAITGGIFVFYYVMFFIAHVGPCPTVGSPDGAAMIVPRDLWLYLLYMVMASALLAASLIDA